MGRENMTDQQAEEKIKKIVEAVLKEMYPQGGCNVGNCYRSLGGIPRLFYIDYSLPEPIKKGMIEFTYKQLSDESDKQLEKMALGQIESS